MSDNHIDCRKAKLYAFPGGGCNTAEGDNCGDDVVWASPRLYRCQQCGNTRAFYGRARAEVTLMITAVYPFQYDVAQYTIDESAPMSQEVISCAQCGSTNIVEYSVNLDASEMVRRDDDSGKRTVYKIMTDVDPLPLNERDVILGPDGRWYVGCQRTQNVLQDPDDPIP